MVENIALNMDCMDFLKKCSDKQYDLCVVDPPYGIDVGNMNMGAGTSPRCSKIENRIWKPTDWDKAVPTDEYFQELFRVSQNQIIWGGNYFNLPSCRCFLIWDKGEGLYGRSFSECEFAWTSFNEPSRIFKYSPVKTMADEEYVYVANGKIFFHSTNGL